MSNNVCSNYVELVEQAVSIMRRTGNPNIPEWISRRILGDPPRISPSTEDNSDSEDIFSSLQKKSLENEQLDYERRKANLILEIETILNSPQ